MKTDRKAQRPVGLGRTSPWGCDVMHAWQQDTGFLRVLEVGGKEADPNTVLFAVSGIITLVVTWHHSGYKEPKEQLASAIFRLMTEPIATVPQ